MVRDDDETLCQLVRNLDVEIVRAKDAHLGMGHSLAAGFRAITWDWTFVGLLDMPYVADETLAGLREFARDNLEPSISIIRPCTSNPVRYGHPVGWARTHYEAIRKCTGDEGARGLVQAWQHEIFNLEVSDEGIHADIDTPADIDAANIK